jgi:hypothetical protein
MSGTGYILLAIRVDRDDDAGELLAVAVGGPPQAWPRAGPSLSADLDLNKCSRIHRPMIKAVS